MKAQAYFGGTNPKDKATKSKYKGNTGTASGGSSNLPIRETVKQVRDFSAGSKNTSKQVRDSSFSTKGATKRPNLAGKVDNRSK